MILTRIYCFLSCCRLVSAFADVASGSKTAVGNRNVPGLKKGMDYVQLGDSDLVVSKVCMGTMTYGQQNTLQEGVELLNCAFDKYGVNFLDTAEMYPVPTKAETQGQTDEAIKLFLRGRARQDVVLATKVSGRSDRITWLPRRRAGTAAALTREQIIDSVDASLERLGVDYVDLLQIHWPDRYAGGLFGGKDFLPSEYEKSLSSNDGDLLPSLPVPFEEQLGALQEVIRAGKVRYVGVSNETPYGVCSMVSLAKAFPDLYPKIVSIQNSYSMVNRKDFESGLAEVCYHHKVGSIPYGALAGGTLSGKYRKQQKEGRMTLFPGFMDRYLNSRNEEAVNTYCELAEKSSMSPSELALSWCYHNELVTSTIIGATSMGQLEENLQAYDLKLSDKVQDEIREIYVKYTDPTKR